MKGGSKSDAGRESRDTKISQALLIGRRTNGNLIYLLKRDNCRCSVE